jgi:predicted ArsR family transcriptional regulator
MGMEKPKSTRGRPRKDQYRAHDARRARTYLRNAAGALTALRWELQRNDEVLRYLYVERKRDLQWAMEVGRPLEETLQRLLHALDAQPAPAEGLADG